MKKNPIKSDEGVLPSTGLVREAVLSLLDSRVILFRANKAFPAF